MFNARRKHEFLSTIESKATKKLYKWLFHHTFTHEQRYAKDIYDFNLERIEEWLADTVKSKKLKADYITLQLDNLAAYLNWAYRKDYMYIRDNVLLDRSIRVKLGEKYGTTEDEFFTYEDICTMVGLACESYSVSLPILKNPLDRLSILLPFFGIYGQRAKELLSLKIDDVDFENSRIILRERDNTAIYVDDQCLSLIKETREEINYDPYTYTSYTYTYSQPLDYIVMKESDYLIRPILAYPSTRKQENHFISYTTLLGRFKRYSDYVGQNITLNKLRKSGMLYIAKLILEQEGRLDINNIVPLVNRFDYGTSAASRTQLLTYLKKNLVKVYPETEAYFVEEFASE